MLLLTYPYPELVPHLQVPCTPGQYQQARAPYYNARDKVLILFFPDREDLLATDYWQTLPEYTFAECPLCGQPYRGRADTYSVLGWHWHNDKLDALYHAAAHPPCPHFGGIHEFFNLHGQWPHEIRYLSNRAGEAPRLTPWCLPAEMPAFAVLHALPICRLEAEQFVPVYTVFILTYFSAQPALLLKRHYAVEGERGKGDPEFYPATFSQPGMDEFYDQERAEPYYALAEYAERGQLGWLDYERPDLPLRLGKGLALPGFYQHVEGRRYQYTWRKGKFGR